MALGILLPRALNDSQRARKVVGRGSRYRHVVNLARPEDLDWTVRNWLDEAYLSAG